MQNNWKKVYPSVWNRAKEILANDGVVVLPTDTLYGIVGNAFSKKAVQKIYKIKGRNENKPFIVLITSFLDLEKFGVKRGEKEAKIFLKFWPGKVSIILPCKLAKFEYIHRGTNSIAFRMIGKRSKNLYELINKVGPIVAPSCNTQGNKPAVTNKEAKKYFGDDVDLYIDSGKKDVPPSKLLKYENGEFIVLRS